MKPDDNLPVHAAAKRYWPVERTIRDPGPWKQFLSFLVCVSLMVGLLSCSAKPKTWEEHFDLGVRYLQDGKYEDAVLAFTAAIEIDPKHYKVYMGRGDAFMHIADESGEDPQESYESALADYLAALDLNASEADPYSKAADVYLKMGQTEDALAILQKGYDALQSQTLLDRIQGDEFAEIRAEQQRQEEEEQEREQEEAERQRMTLLADCPYVGDRSAWRMSVEQAQAFLQVIRNAQAKVEEENRTSPAPEMGRTEVYATLFDVNGNTALLISYIFLSSTGDNPPGNWEQLDNSEYVLGSQEIWEWDGTQAAEYTMVSDYRAYVLLRQDAVEIFYNEPGSDGSVDDWDAYFAYGDGRIETDPTWCRAHSSVIDYYLMPDRLSNMDTQPNETVREYFESQMSGGEWPQLPMDWSTVQVNTIDPGSRWYVGCSYGHGFEQLYGIEDDPLYGPDYDWPFAITEAGQPGVLLSASDIGRHSDSWGTAETISNLLTTFVQSV